ncbi:DC-STAMP domain-containing protein 2-like [Perca fluviatilis]|uniref:DC-STAMP domain-containing protein 2-like n=1 Tax=Perca fluviatilis TaxID=8168 RepID=UPI001962D4CB|nr:DC-STAMP domain-containing protein 2-like [Perca fluviatilis]
MKDEKRRRYLTVQVEKGGVRRAVRGVLNRSAGRSDLGGWRKFRGHLLEEGRSLLPFGLGLLMASVYGATALFLQNQPLWLCVYTTLTLAALAAFGMGLSAGVRANVSVLMPTLCSAFAKFLLFLFVSLLLTGPLSKSLGKHGGKPSCSLLGSQSNARADACLT